MTTRSQATAAPIEVTINGNVYKVSPLTDKDIGELDNWLRMRLITLARETAKGLPDDERQKLMDDAFRSAMSMSWIKDRGLIRNTPEGMTRFVYQLFKREQPNLTMDQLTKDLNADENALSLVLDVFKLLHGVIGDVTEDESEEEKKG